ncbi:MAG: carboxypeptidase regulatory-like domain-containing protein [Pyrinomonadaceae bacterium]
MMQYKKVALISIWVFLLAFASYSQGTTGQISGTVVDPTGAVIPGATVSATNQSTNAVRETITNSTGVFSFQVLPVGRYTVKVSAEGFAARSMDASVFITQTTVLNVSLAVGEVAENVVDVEPPLAQVETAQTGRVINEVAIRQLPLPTRNFQQLLTLSAGAQNSLSNSTELGRGDTTITVNGQRTTSNSVRINGVDANSIGTNSTPNIAVPATESLQEFIVQTSLYDASSGRNSGGNVEAITKSGSNEFHGNAYYFYRNDALNANDPFVKAAGLKRPVLDRQQFGGTLGGRLIRDRLFFFGSYQGTREKNGASLTNSLTVPMIPAGLTDTNRSASAIGTAFGVNPLLVTPQAVAILNAQLPGGGYAIPSTNASGLTAKTGVTNVQSGISRFRENQFNANIDLNFTDNHSLSAKFFFADNPTKQANYNFAGLGNGPNQLVGFGGDLTIKQKLYSIKDNWIISPNAVNQFTFGFSRMVVTSVPEEPFTASELGISSTLSSIYPGAPTISVVGSDSSFVFGSATLADQSSRINGYSAGDTLYWTNGNHRFKFGGEYRFSQVKFYFNAFSRGQLIFNDSYTNGVLTATAFQNFLTGSGLSLLGSGDYSRYFRVTDWSGFVQDDWRITNKLTVNLGVRYDFYGLPAEDQGRLVNFLEDQYALGSPPNGFVQAEGGSLTGVPTVDKTLVPADRNNFAPRIGFAYQFDDNITFRGGYGIYFDRISTRYANTQLFNFPYFALGVGLVNNTYHPYFPTTYQSMASPFIPLPQPSQFPNAATIPSPLTSLAPIVGVPIAGVFVDPNLETPYVQQYNFGVQVKVAKDMLAEIGYVGNRGTHLLQVITLNQPVYNSATKSFIPRIAPSNILSANKNLTGGMQQVQTTSLSRYNSLQMSLTKRLSNGLQFLAAFTAGNSMDYYSGAAVNELTNMPGDQWNWRSNYGPSDFNRKLRFVFSGTYMLPKFVDNTNAARWLLNDWQVAGIGVWQSGLPFSVIDSNGTSIVQRANFATSFNGDYEGSGAVSDRLNRYFNTSAFGFSRLGFATFDPSNPFGNTWRNMLTGPTQKNLDVSFVKFIPFSEKIRGEFRAEFFNAFNWVNYANPGSTIGTSGFGKITSASSGPRTIQFGFKLGF